MKKTNYEENFFSTLYKSHTGNFEEKDLLKNKKWFYGWIRFIKKSVNFKKGKVLEIGSTIGAVVSLLKADGYDVYGSDISSFAINKAKKLNPDIKFRVFDLQKGISFNLRFDYILAFEVLEHLSEPEKGINSVYNKLNKGGYFIFTSPPPFKRFIETPTHISVKSHEEWVSILMNTGFKKSNIKYKKVTFPPLLYRINKRLNFGFPVNLDIKKINSTIFYFAKK